VVALAGATGALGKEILAVLERAPWNPSAVVPLASAGSTVPFVEFSDRQIAVDDLANFDAAEVDLIIAAVPDDVARPLVDEAVQLGVAVVDCSAAFHGDPDVPAIVPWVNPMALNNLPRGVARVPSAPAMMLSSVLGPLARSGVEGPADAVVMVPASHWGRSGIDELSRQVVTLFNAGAAPRKVFPDGLAFDLLPQVGGVQADGWTDLEHRIIDDARLVSGWTGELRVTVIGVPVFSGMGAELRIRTGRALAPDLIHRILIDGGNRAAEEEGARFVPRPRRVEGTPFASVGRVRSTPDGGLTVWLAMDNLRATATVAVATGGAVLRDR
jgi:aspartate-semialdehyde dehydrogenase